MVLTDGGDECQRVQKRWRKGPAVLGVGTGARDWARGAPSVNWLAGLERVHQRVLELDHLVRSQLGPVFFVQNVEVLGDAPQPLHGRWAHLVHYFVHPILTSLGQTSQTFTKQAHIVQNAARIGDVEG